MPTFTNILLRRDVTLPEAHLASFIVCNPQRKKHFKEKNLALPSFFLPPPPPIDIHLVGYCRNEKISCDIFEIKNTL